MLHAHFPLASVCLESRARKFSFAMLVSVVTRGGHAHGAQVERQLREQLAAEQKSSAGLIPPSPYLGIQMITL